MSVLDTADNIAARLKKLTPEQREQLLALATPRIVEPYIAHIPHPKQQVFLTLNTREALYGGAAGGGKSDAVLMAAMQYVDVPGYSALILRRTWPDLNAPGAILDRAKTWLAGTDAAMKDGGRLWVFPSGAKLSFGYMQHDKDKYKFQSAEYQFIGFDELTHFEEEPYLYLFSRLRRPDLVCLNCSEAVRPYKSTRRNSAGEKRVIKQFKHTRNSNPCDDLFPDPKVIEQYPASKDGLSVFDIPLRMRSATNPGGIGHEWVKARFIDEATREKKAIFVPARLKDNPSLDRESYAESLSHLSAVDRERLENGDWDIALTGDFFKRHWFTAVPGPTIGNKAYLVRYWDMASTEGGGDYTVGLLLALMPDGRYEIRDVVRGQWSPETNERIVANTAASDGRYVPIRMEMEGGSSGKNIISHYMRNVVGGYNFDGVRPSGSKEARAYPVSVAAERHLIDIVAAEWNKNFFNEVEAFPTGGHDDQVDALSGAFEFLNFGRRGRVLV